MDDVIEVLAEEEPLWEQAPAGSDQAPLPGKSGHLFIGEDTDAIERLWARIMERRDDEGS